MTLTRRTLMAAASAAALMAHPIAAAAQDLPRNVRMVIGSTSTGGDTYQNSAIVADALADHLDINVKVDAVGASAAFKALDRDSRGNTIMIFHDQSYLGNIYGVTGYQNPFENYTVGATVAINPGNAYLVPADSPYSSMEDIFAAAEAGEKVRCRDPARRRVRDRLLGDEERGTRTCAWIGGEHRSRQHRIASRQEPGDVG